VTVLDKRLEAMLANVVEIDDNKKIIVQLLTARCDGNEVKIPVRRQWYHKKSGKLIRSRRRGSIKRRLQAFGASCKHTSTVGSGQSNNLETLPLAVFEDIQTGPLEFLLDRFNLRCQSTTGSGWWWRAVVSWNPVASFWRQNVEQHGLLDFACEQTTSYTDKCIEYLPYTCSISIQHQCIKCVYNQSPIWIFPAYLDVFLYNLTQNNHGARKPKFLFASM